MSLTNMLNVSLQSVSSERFGQCYFSTRNCASRIMKSRAKRPRAIKSHQKSLRRTLNVLSLGRPEPWTRSDSKDSGDRQQERDIVA
jgi:hypothetical protein